MPLAGRWAVWVDQALPQALPLWHRAYTGKRSVVLVGLGGAGCGHIGTFPASLYRRKFLRLRADLEFRLAAGSALRFYCCNVGSHLPAGTGRETATNSTCYAGAGTDTDWFPGRSYRWALTAISYRLYARITHQFQSLSHGEGISF